MHLLLPSEIVDQMAAALVRAGRREIGGVLMGEHVGPELFRVKELTVQRGGGTFASFVRLVQGVLAPLKAFFHATHHNYTRFNYLGEWHSHHSFALTPSGTDHNTMFEIIDDPQLGANFVVLLLAKLGEGDRLDCGVYLYQRKAKPRVGQVVQEHAGAS
jgi:hypothetical protein